MVQPAKNRMRNNVSEPLDRTCVGRVLPERNVGSHLIIIGGILRKNSSKMIFADYDHMISALAPAPSTASAKAETCATEMAGPLAAAIPASALAATATAILSFRSEQVMRIAASMDVFRLSAGRMLSGTARVSRSCANCA
jgi:hypothetical protein